jgi:hypothetical protein
MLDTAAAESIKSWQHGVGPKEEGRDMGSTGYTGSKPTRE